MAFNLMRTYVYQNISFQMYSNICRFDPACVLLLFIIGDPSDNTAWNGISTVTTLI